jgi:hypothetical protein
MFAGVELGAATRPPCFGAGGALIRSAFRYADHLERVSALGAAPVARVER